MKNVKLLIAMLATAAVAACTDAPGEGGGNSVLIDASQLNPTFTAAPGSRTIGFTALKPWTATLEETTRTAPDWVELDKYAGDAGEVSITISILQENTSDQARHAQLTILSGDSRVTVRIEQKAIGDDTPDNPDDPEPVGIRYVSRVDYLLVDNREKEQKRETISQTFRYDERNRVVEIVEEYALSEKDKGTHRYRLDYTTAGQLTVTESDVMESGDEILNKIAATLDEKGRITEATTTCYYDTPFLSAKEICTYDSEGRIGGWLSKHSCMDDGNLDTYSENKFFYNAEGMLTRYTYYDSYDNEGWEEEFPAAQFYPNRIANDKSNLDFTFYALAGAIDELEDPQVLFTLLRLTGGGFGKYLPETTVDAYDDSDIASPVQDGWPTPNVTIHESSDYIECTLGEEEYLPLGFTTDADGYITQIAYNRPYAEYRHEYDIVVGNEVIADYMNDPDFPEEEKRYKCEIQNSTTTKLRDISNPVTIGITYR
ncbi:BACON domain-containing carbohydrate-binding protein [uncultured Alistipes sp.]|uniref:BACON domain-containing protein n=1 Tax=uncultured Alistipes sp. TaxID=538949 RepID=UPI00259159F5|nr:BACON domain-containing carbohydrate-binding protein [uncultured Alistipes sp.]